MIHETLGHLSGIDTVFRFPSTHAISYAKSEDVGMLGMIDKPPIMTGMSEGRKGWRASIGRVSG